MAEQARLDDQHPWPGLASFGEGDQAYFRGREREADELARLVRRERLTVLFGRSGLGKSSLLNAGLFPRLRQDLHLPVYLRLGWGADASPRQQVWDALAAACAAGGVQAPSPEPGETLWDYFHRAGAGFWNPRRRPLLPVLVFDQFEEIFTLGQADDTRRASARAFVDELADLVENRPSQALRTELDADPARSEAFDFERRGCKLLLSFREDFLAEVEGLRQAMPSLMRNRFRLLPMDGAQARAVVASGGALVAGGTDGAVADRIIGLAWRNRAVAPTAAEAERVEVDPALLSVICSELNLRRIAQGAAAIEAGLLDSAEREILVDFYERSLQGLHPGVRQFVEDELITAAGYRDSFAYDDALARPGLGADALDRLVAGRLLRMDERFGVRRLELTHDVLTRVVMASRDQRREREAREQAERERAQAQQAALLAQRRLRRSRRLAVAMTLTALVAIGLLGLTVQAFHWASSNSLTPDSMLTLQKYRFLRYAPLPALAWIPPGSFDLGEQDPDFIQTVQKRSATEPAYFGLPGTPAVVIAKGFFMGRFEVTYDEFDYYVWMQNRADGVRLGFPSTALGGRGQQPVGHVNAAEAMAYADWLGGQLTPRLNCRLPTEAEWEYSARAGSRTGYWWGGKIGVNNAVCDGCGSGLDGRHSYPVGHFPANPFGLHDTAGNVLEWTCSKWRLGFGGDAQQCAVPTDPSERVIRGGSLASDTDYLRSAARNPLDPSFRRGNTGFRVLCAQRAD